jgi:hypothetical protein
MAIGVLRGGALAGGVAGAGAVEAVASGFAGVGAGVLGGGVDFTNAGVALGVGVGVPGFGVLGAGVAGLGELGAGVAAVGAGDVEGEGVFAVPGSAARSDGANVAQPRSAANATLVCLKRGIMGCRVSKWAAGIVLSSAKIGFF